MTKEEFLEARDLGLTFTQIGAVFSLTERQISYRINKWGLSYSNKKGLDHEFFSRDTNAVYYWAGMLASDGWIEGDRHRVGLAFKAEDIDHLEKFKLAISSDHKICPFMSNTAYRIRFNSEKMCKDLESRFNVVPAKTHVYTMPHISNKDYLLEFLRGYIDGDGSLNKTASGRVALSLCSANIEFLQAYKDICSEFIGRSIPQDIYLNESTKGSVFSLRLTLNDSRDMLNLLYKNSTESTRLDRKYLTACLVLD